MLKYDLFLLAFLITGLKGMSQDSIPLAFSSEIFYDVYDEWIEIKIINDETDSVWYDTTATVFYDGGFSDTIYLDSGSYKFYIPDIGANVSMPVLTICQHVIPWHVSGEGSDEYYAFTLPCTYFFDNIPENSGDSYCRIYPNPAKDIVYLTFDSKAADIKLGLYDLKGTRIMEQDAHNKDDIMLNTSELLPGIYYLSIRTPGKVTTKKLCISSN